MNEMARIALEDAYRARLTDHVIEYKRKPVKSIKAGYRGALQRAGLEGIDIHQIRHTVAVTLIQNGTPIERVAQFLGHSNTATTRKVYARYLPEHLQEDATHLEFVRFSEPVSPSSKGEKM